MSIDDALADAAPPTAPRTLELERDIHALVLETELSTRRRGRRHRRIGIAIASAISVLPLTAAASGMVTLPAWVPWTTDNANNCRMTPTASALGSNGWPLGDASDSDLATRRAVEEGSRFLSEFDYDSIDRSAAIARFRAQPPAPFPWQEMPDDARPLPTGDELELAAIYAEMRSRLEEHLRAEGLVSDRVGFGLAWKCE